MTPLTATLYNAAISKCRDGDLPYALLNVWALTRLAGSTTPEGLVDSFRVHLLSAINTELASQNLERAHRLDRLGAMLDPDIHTRLEPTASRRHSIICMVDGRNALREQNSAQVLGFCLAALAYDPENVDAARLLASETNEWSAGCSVLDKGAPTIDEALHIAIASALGVQRARRLLLDLLAIFEDHASSLLLSAQVLADRETSFSDRIAAMKAMNFVRHRRQGDEAATAQDKAKKDVCDYLVALGPAAALDDAVLNERVTNCFDYLGYRRTLEDLRELRRRRPEDQWIAYNLCVILRNALHPDVKESVDLATRQPKNSLDTLKLSFNMTSMIGATPQKLALAERLTEHEPSYSIFGPLHQMATDLDARPDAVFGRARTGRRLLYANLVCWGEAYIELMEQASIASLLAPGNVPALVEHVDLVIELFTMPADLQRLLQSALLRRLGDYCEIRVHTFPDSVAAQWKDWPYDIYGHAMHATAFRAERDGADITFLMPDIIYADGGYGLIGRKATSAPRAIFVDSLNAYAAPMLDRMLPFRRGDALVVSSEDLADAALGCPSKRTIQSIYQTGDRWTCAEPTRVIFPLEGGLRTHGFMMLPIYVSHAALAPVQGVNFLTPDGMFLEHVLNSVSDDQLEVLSGTEFCFVEVCDHDGVIHSLVEGSLADTIKDFFVNFGFGRNRIRLFERPIDFPTRSPPDFPLVSEAEAAARVSDVRAMFVTDPLMVDVAEEQERVRRMYYS